MSKSRLSYENRLIMLHSMFEEKTTFQFARKIWLFCNRNNLDVPQDVLTLFVKGIQKQHDEYVEIIIERMKKRKRFIHHAILYRYVEYLRKKGYSQTEAFDRYIKIMLSKKDSYFERKGLKKKNFSEIAVRKRYFRFRPVRGRYGL